MSTRSQMKIDLFAMLSDMTTANGYSQDYTPVKSALNASATVKQVPWISLKFGTETPLEEGVGMSQYRQTLPIMIIVRINAPHGDKTEIEYVEDIEVSDAIEDIKKRFGYAHRELSNCGFMNEAGEIDAAELDLEDSNKNVTFAAYQYDLQYTTGR